jgi:hypothetical protein
MSRRVTLLVLAASVALIANQASAAPDCYGDACKPTPARSFWPMGRAEKTMPREAAPTLVEGARATDGQGTAYEMNGRTRRAYGPYAPLDGDVDAYGDEYGYVVGFPFALAPYGFVGPGLFYGGYLGRPVYLFAPNAKVIRLDRGNN